MNGENLLGGVATDEGVFEELADGVVEGEGVGGDGFEDGAEFGSSFREDFFGDGVGGEEGAEGEAGFAASMFWKESCQVAATGSGWPKRLAWLPRLLRSLERCV